MSDAFVLCPIDLPRGCLALCPLPRDVADRHIVADFGPALVISLTEPAERAALGAADLPDWVTAQGFDWHLWPIPDFGTPPPQADWPGLARKARAILSSGGRVLVHCRGGLGRSGMVVLRLMIETGEDPDAALLRLREKRPGAVETDAQLDWARAQGTA